MPKIIATTIQLWACYLFWLVGETAEFSGFVRVSAWLLMVLFGFATVNVWIKK